mgnify:CR=1 FL=1
MARLLISLSAAAKGRAPAALASDISRKSRSRGRDGRDITVPTRISSTFAVSTYGSSSTVTSSSTVRCSSGNLRRAIRHALQPRRGKVVAGW